MKSKVKKKVDIGRDISDIARTFGILALPIIIFLFAPIGLALIFPFLWLVYIAFIAIIFIAFVINSL